MANNFDLQFCICQFMRANCDPFRRESQRMLKLNVAHQNLLEMITIQLGKLNFFKLNLICALDCSEFSDSESEFQMLPASIVSALTIHETLECNLMPSFRCLNGPHISMRTQ